MEADYLNIHRILLQTKNWNHWSTLSQEICTEKLDFRSEICHFPYKSPRMTFTPVCRGWQVHPEDFSGEKFVHPKNWAVHSKLKSLKFKVEICTLQENDKIQKSLSLFFLGISVKTTRLTCDSNTHLRHGWREFWNLIAWDAHKMTYSGKNDLHHGREGFSNIITSDVLEITYFGKMRHFHNALRNFEISYP